MQVRLGFEVIGEFSFLCGTWWERDYYVNDHQWLYVAGEYWPFGDMRWLKAFNLEVREWIGNRSSD